MKQFSKPAEALRTKSRRVSRLLLSAVALALLISIAAGGIWHVHSTPESAAACTACHIGHAPAITSVVLNSLLPEAVEIGSISCADPILRAAPVFSSKTSRAPPVNA